MPGVLLWRHHWWAAEAKHSLWPSICTLQSFESCQEPATGGQQTIMWLKTFWRACRVLLYTITNVLTQSNCKSISKLFKQHPSKNNHIDVILYSGALGNVASQKLGNVFQLILDENIENRISYIMCDTIIKIVAYTTLKHSNIDFSQ